MAIGSIDRQVLRSMSLIFIALKKKLILEIDGFIHLLYGNPESDLIRQRFLEKLGFKVLRFTNEEVKNSIGTVLLKILAELE